MIKHIVMWKLAGETATERAVLASRVKELFEGLRSHVPGLLHLEIGIDVSHVEYACDVVLYSEFESEAALEAYGSHPEHLRVRQLLGEVRTARFQVDYRTYDRNGSGA